ncbi:lysophospholipid acyltransferase family protein [Sutcliffiella horikoshii]|uniref:lysophospholipid acyltransferase family protein n=1 Tax=Sutcliffiella horikoshii TaxID=79883 RepID=UPI001F39B379|nr:lysophospholipid acyltransferase family protein [Sutcliffiella horikoshii]MCG1023158.1 1-acyl-sn-glycerol-3-phosphate acyltransferase [Sutcliffiella horikoshii]
MLRTIWWFVYFFCYLIYSLPTIKKVKKLDPTLTVEEKDTIIHQKPKHWAKTLVKLTGSEIEVIGEEKIPQGPVLFVSNHQGNFDVPILIGFLQKPLGFISKVEVKKIPLVPRWMEAMNCVFIDRKDRRKAIQSIREGVQTLKDGHSLVIFPEGTRSKGNEMGDFKKGGLRLATDSKVPVVPITISGSYRIMEESKFGFQPAHVRVTVHDPIFLPEDEKVDGNQLGMEIQNKIMQYL